MTVWSTGRWFRVFQKSNALTKPAGPSAWFLAMEPRVMLSGSDCTQGFEPPLQAPVLLVEDDGGDDTPVEEEEEPVCDEEAALPEEDCPIVDENGNPIPPILEAPVLTLIDENNPQPGGDIVVITSDDDVEDDVPFVVEGNVAVALVSIEFPDSVVEGQSARGKARITVTNTTNARLPEEAKLTVALLATPNGGGDPVLLASKTNASVSSLKPGQSKTFTLSFNLPNNLAADTYSFSAAAANATDDDDEVIDDDNDDSFTVGEVQVNLTTRIGKSKIPLNFFEGQAIKGNVKVTVTNDSNVELDDDQVVDAVVKLRPIGAIDDSQDIQIGADDIDVGGLDAGKSKSANVRVMVQDIDPGEYTIVVVITPRGELEETDDDDNEYVNDEDDDIIVGESGVDLRIDETEVEIEQEDDETEAEAEVQIRNSGNQLASGEVTVTIRGVDAMDNETVLGTQTLNLALAPGRERTIKLSLVLPQADAAQDLDLFVDLSAPTITETNTENNTKAIGSITVLPDLTQMFNQIAFTQTQAPAANGTDLVSSGTVSTGQGATGTYEWRVTDQGKPRDQRVGRLIITLDEPASPSGNIVIELDFEELSNRPASLHGQVLTLIVSGDDDSEDSMLAGGPGLLVIDENDPNSGNGDLPQITDTDDDDDDDDDDDNSNDDDDDDDDDTPGNTLGEFKILSFGNLLNEYEGYFNLTAQA
jgi:hypothetical protein